MTRYNCRAWLSSQAHSMAQMLAAFEKRDECVVISQAVETAFNVAGLRVTNEPHRHKGKGAV